MNDALWNMECGKATILTAMDLSVAFNTVDHDILLDILHDQFRLTGTALNWFNQLSKASFVCGNSTKSQIQ